MKYEDAPDGEWFAPRMRGYRMMCCDCGLVHRFDFRKTDDGIEMRGSRDERATAAARRRKQVAKTKKRRPKLNKES